MECSAAEVWETLGSRLTESRQKKIQNVCAQRCQSLVPVLEGIYDRGNISAVMRSAEAFGFYRFHVVEHPENRFKAANRVTQGTDKWLRVEKYSQAGESVLSLRSQGYKVFATHLEASVPIDQIDFTQKVAVVFGNEKDGVSQEMLDLVDGTFILPMQGFAQSFNISVAAALTFSYAYWERVRRLGKCADLDDQAQMILMANYALRSFDNPDQILKELIKRRS
ncbi:MAG: RNA methyltransferase [Bdellovibrionaceae bacterium]|nr:RNA methyltransferase [Bdellovibrionales bacterium]MCB9084340.1 RNA methyltransferase [Pseudobdellovibrionaceae bacterium]